MVLANRFSNTLNPNITGSVPERPPGFDWDYINYPITFGPDGVPFFPLEDYFASCLSGPAYYCSPSGSSGNDGLSAATPKLSISSAITLANAGGVPCRIYCAAGHFIRNNGFNPASVNIGVDIAFIAHGGRAVVSVADNLSYSSVGSGVYSVTRSAVNRVFDIRTTDEFGSYTELTNVADLSACTATPGSWAQVSTTLYVHLSDGAVVSDSNTRAMLQAGNVAFSSVTPRNVYFNGFDFEGASQGVLNVSYDVPAPNPVIVGARNCTFKYGGGIISTTLGDGARIDNLNGLACFIDCESNSNYKDGFNIHNTNNSGKYKTYMMTINCRGLNNGRGVSTSNNGLTAHENASIFDYNGYYDYNYGGSLHNIGTSHGWAVKTQCLRSQGDGVGISPSEFIVADTAKLWMDRTIASPGTAVGAFACSALTGTSQMYRRNHLNYGGVDAVTAGSIMTNW